MLGLSRGEVVKLLPYIARYGANVALEKLIAGARLDVFRIPPAAEAITPGWLTRAICGRIEGAAVENVRCSGGSDGTTSRRELEVDYNAAGRAAGLPKYLFTKSTPRLTNRLVGCSIGKIVAEVTFYREIRPLLDVEATRSLYAGYDSTSGRCMMVFEDLSKAFGCKFLGGPASYVSREMAEGMVALMAGYHAPLWNSPRLQQPSSWLRTTLDFQKRINSVLGFQERCNIGFDRAAVVVPETLRSRKQLLWASHMRSLELHVRPPLTIAHWDTHIGNWYQTADKRMGLSDWCMMTGQWAGDFAYAISSALTIEDRRAWERDLITMYLTHLDRAGATPLPTMAEAFLAYRQQMFHPLFYWAITIGAGKLQPNMQPDNICLENLRRMSQAVIDLDSLSAVQNS